MSDPAKTPAVEPSAKNAAEKPAEKAAEQPAKVKRKPRWGRRALISLVILVLGWTGIWFGYAYFLKQQSNALFMAQEEGEDEQRPQQLRAADRWITGYPFGWYLHFDKPEVVSADTGSRFSADRAWVGFHLSDFRNITWQSEGNIQAALPVPTNNPTMPVAQMTITAESADGFFTLSDLGPRDPHLTFTGVTLRVGAPPSRLTPAPVDEDAISLDQERPVETGDGSPFSGTNPLPELSVDSLEVALLSPVWPPTQPGDPALTVEAALNGIQGTLPAGATRLPVGELSEGIERFHFTLTLTGPLPRGVHAVALAQWRDAGGAVELDDLLVDLGDVNLVGTGRGLLDPALQPAVNLDMEVKGYRLLLDRLVNEGTIQRLMADFANTMLQPLITRDEDGAETLAISLGLRDRWVMIGPMQLMRIPPIHWTGSAQ